MRELSMNEVESVAGAGIIRDVFGDVRWVVGELPDFYRETIGAMTELMCIATGNC